MCLPWYVCIHFNKIITFRQPKCDEEMKWTANKQTNQFRTDITHADAHVRNRYAGKQSIGRCRCRMHRLHVKCIFLNYVLKFMESQRKTTCCSMDSNRAVQWEICSGERSASDKEMGKTVWKTFSAACMNVLSHKWKAQITLGVHCLHSGWIKTKPNKNRNSHTILTCGNSWAWMYCQALSWPLIKLVRG